MKKILLFSTLLLLLTSCQSTQQWLNTKPVPFQNGYNAGCQNGEDMASNSYVEKDNETKVYKDDDIYRSGWDEGYQDCYSDKEFENMTRRRF